MKKETEEERREKREEKRERERERRATICDHHGALYAADEAYAAEAKGKKRR